MDLLTATQAAKRLGVSRQTVVNRCLAGKVRGAQKVGRDWVIPVKALEKFEVRLPGRPRKERAE